MSLRWQMKLNGFSCYFSQSCLRKRQTRLSYRSKLVISSASWVVVCAYPMSVFKEITFFYITQISGITNAMIGTFFLSLSVLFESLVPLALTWHDTVFYTEKSFLFNKTCRFILTGDKLSESDEKMMNWEEFNLIFFNTALLNSQFRLVRRCWLVFFNNSSVEAHVYIRQVG